MPKDDQGSPDFTIRKKVDESWKSAVEREKGPSSFDEPASEFAVEPSFSFFVSTLGMQALVALGELANPATQEKKADLTQAQYLIEVLRMISDKTKGNLTQEEEAMMKDLVYDLQMKFVEKSKQV